MKYSSITSEGGESEPLKGWRPDDTKAKMIPASGVSYNKKKRAILALSTGLVAGALVLLMVVLSNTQSSSFVEIDQGGSIVTLQSQEHTSSTSRTAPSIADLTEAIDAKMEGFLREHNVDGASVGILFDGKPAYVRGFGNASITTGAPYEPGTISQLGGISTTLTAWAVMQLVEEGLVELEKPVEDYISWRIPNKHPNRWNTNGVTIQRLLSHTAGIGEVGYSGFVGMVPDTKTALDAQKDGCCIFKDSWEPGNGDTRLSHEPGKEYIYSGAGYHLLQLLLEEVRGEPFAELMYERVLKPLGMTSSGYWAAPAGDNAILARTAEARCLPRSNRFCRRFTVQEGRVPNYLFSAASAAGLYSTAEDMLKFLAAHTAAAPPTGTLKANTLQDIMLRKQPNSEDGPRTTRGLGYQLVDLPVASEGGTVNAQLAGHQGFNIGWVSEFGVVTEAGVGFTVSTNGNSGDGVVSDFINDIFVPWLGGFPG